MDQLVPALADAAINKVPAATKPAAASLKTVRENVISSPGEREIALMRIQRPVVRRRAHRYGEERSQMSRCRPELARRSAACNPQRSSVTCDLSQWQTRLPSSACDHDSRFIRIQWQ
jgi:hypothetical protein